MVPTSYCVPFLLGSHLPHTKTIDPQPLRHCVCSPNLPRSHRFIRGPTGGIISDRPFNIAAKVEGFIGQPLVESVSYDSQKDPTRCSVLYKTPRRDSR